MTWIVDDDKGTTRGGAASERGSCNATLNQREFRQRELRAEARMARRIELTQPPVPSPRTEYTSQLSLPPLGSSHATTFAKSSEPVMVNSRTY